MTTTTTTYACYDCDQQFDATPYPCIECGRLIYPMICDPCYETAKAQYGWDTYLAICIPCANDDI